MISYDTQCHACISVRAFAFPFFRSCSLVQIPPTAAVLAHNSLDIGDITSGKALLVISKEERVFLCYCHESVFREYLSRHGFPGVRLSERIFFLLIWRNYKNTRKGMGLVIAAVCTRRGPDIPT